MIPTVSELRKLKVAELREKLSSLGLPIGGLKNDLIERLHKYYEQQEQEQETASPEAATELAEPEKAEEIDDEEALKSEEAQKLIESEQKRILEQQKERLAQRKQKQIEEEQLRQQQEAAAKVLDEEARQKAIQQQQLIEQQRLAEQQKLLQQQQIAQQQLLEEKAKEEELLRQQQMALLIKQREEEAKIRQQQEMIRMQEEQQHQHQAQTRQPLLPTPSASPRPLLPTPQSQPPPAPPPTQGMPPSQQGPPPRQPPPPPPPSERQQLRPLLPTPDRRDLGPSQPPPHHGVRGAGQPPVRGPPPPPSPPEEEEESQKKAVKLPQALEKVLAFKDVRKQQIGTTEDEETAPEPERNVAVVPDVEIEELDDTVDDEPIEVKPTQPESKESKNKRRKKKKKKRKERQREEQMRREALATVAEKDEDEEDVEVEYIQEDLTAEIMDPSFMHFRKIFEAFKLADAVKPEKEEKAKELKEKVTKKPEADHDMSDSDYDDDDDDMDDDRPKISKKKLRKLNRLSVAELKQLVTRPDVVEMHDVTAQDPKLLVHLKATRNTVPVPRHWCFKRKYLQGKRGIEKPPFELPDFIKRTGIMEMREALQEKEEQKTMKAKMREKVRPKMGKIDIDYQKLHDAFFKWQSKPKMTIHGDLYYEGKEFETRLKEKKPGELSDELRTALGMPIGPNAQKFPPPWLIAMQRYGPPPSYPNLKIPGLNAAIPESCSFGYHAGGWGKPPVDEAGKPLYGDVFGTNATDFQAPVEEEEIDRTPWGELESESEEEEEEEEESSSDEEKPDDTGLITPAEGGLITPSGITSVPAGMETPEMIELRKKKIEDAMEQGGETPQLYTILPEKKAQAVGAAMMGSTYTYDLVGPKKTGQAPGGTDQGIAVALDPSELDLDTAAIEAKYEETVREQQNQLEKEDLSDMVAEHAAKQKKKRKAQQSQDSKPSKKYKEFKF